ncbi:MAG TPA: class I SAM-dependent methyltransferase [Streptosporangiaceae bacterium]|nr:class I SAM-dependent methyltransferase [Streptosporangiaceae bacterium]
MAEPADAVQAFEALLTPEGQELLHRLRHEDDPAGLRLGTELRARYPVELVTAALAQHELRLRARAKFSRALDMYFTRPGLEQASAEVVAGHRSARYARAGLVADLCCGIGGDLVALAAGRGVLAVDRDRLHLRMAQANAVVYGVAAGLSAVAADVREVSLGGAVGPGLAQRGVDAVFVDPARRAGGRRLRAGDSEPPLAWCLALAGQVPRVGIKAAPGLPRDAVPPGWELEFIAVGRDLKEAVAWSPALATAATRATVLPGGHTLTQGPGGPVPVRPPGGFLLDPNPAVTRAGLVADLARAAGAWKIDDKIAFLSADVPVRTPFARTLRIIDSAPWDQRRLPARLRALDIGAADIRRRGLAGDVDSLHRRLRLSGSRRATVVMTRVRDRPWGLVCVDV